MDPFKLLADRLESDPSKRVKFLSDLQNLLAANGVDITNPEIARIFGSNTVAPMKCRGVSPQIIVCEPDE
jgi:hypothetical protein